MISIFKKVKEPYSEGGSGDGTKASPWYWHSLGGTDTVSVNNTNADPADDCRLYFRIKLKGGTAYNISQTAPGGYDGRIYLYDEAWKVLDEGDDTGDGDSTLDDTVSYTPGTDCICYVGAGNYYSDEGLGNYLVRVSPLPEYEAPPNSKLIYTTSSGFDEFGYPMRFDTAMEADVNVISAPTEGLVFSAKLDKAKSVAETGQPLTQINNIVFDTIDKLPCAYFGGESGYVIDPIDVTTFPTQEFTVSFFFISESNEGWMGYVFGRMNETNKAQYLIRVRQDSLQYQTGIQNLQGYNKTSSVNIPASNSWRHAAYRFKDGYIDFFLDGKLIYTDTTYLGKANSGNTTIGLTDYSIANSYYRRENYRGYLALLRMYNRPLTDLEIDQLSKERRSVGGLLDMEDAEKDIEPVFTSEFESADGFEVTGSLVFSAEDGMTYVSLNGNSALSNSIEGLPQGAAERTVAFRCRLSDTSNVGAVVCWGKASANSSYTPGFAPGGVFEVWGFSNTTRYDFTATVDKWYHIVVTLSADGRERLYVDGVFQQEKTHTGIATSGNNLIIGNQVEQSAYFSGDISGCAIYDCVLSDEEIVDLYHEMSTPVIPTDGLVFYAPLDVAASSAVTGQTLTQSGSVTYKTVDGVSCAYFDGKSGYTTNAIDLSETDSFTFSAWVKAEGGGCLCARRERDRENQYSFWATQSGIVMTTIDSYGEERARYDFETKSSIYHVVIRYSNGTAEFFADGVLGNSGLVELGTKDSGDTMIAMSYHDSENFVGYLAALRIYNRALSDNEVRALSKEFKI